MAQLRSWAYIGQPRQHWHYKWIYAALRRAANWLRHVRDMHATQQINAIHFKRLRHDQQIQFRC